MPARSVPGLGLTSFWDRGESGWDTGMNENMRLLSVVAAGSVKSRTATLPGSPSQGDIYIVPASDATNPNKIAVWDGPTGNLAWVYINPQRGMGFYVADESKNYQFNGSIWEEFAGAGGGGGSVTANNLVFLTETTYDPSGGNGGTFDSESSSAYASKGMIFTLTESIRFESATIAIYNQGFTGQYKCTLFALDGSNTVTSVVRESSFIYTTGSDLIVEFPFDSITVGTGRYALMVTRTEGVGASPARIAWAGRGHVDSPTFTFIEAMRVADNDITVGETLTYGGSGSSSNSPQFLIRAIPESDLAQASNGLQLDMGALADVDDSTATPGQSLVKQADGTYSFSNIGGQLVVPTWRGATVKLDSDKTAQDISPLVLPFDSVEEDTDGFWSNTNPERLTIPAGVSKVRLSAAADVPASTLAGGADFLLSIRKNGTSAYKGSGSSAGETGFNDVLPSVQTGVVDVVPGDYFDFRINVANENSDTIEALGTYFQIEVVEGPMASLSTAFLPYDIRTGFGPNPGAGETLDRFVFGRNARFEPGFAGSVGAVGTPPAAVFTLTVQKNGAPVGTVIINPDGSFVFSTGGNLPLTFAPGDVMTLEAPVGTDAAVAEASITLFGSAV